MLKNSLAWRMGALYLRRQRRQTLLSMLAGAIGAMLITVSLFHYGAVKTSGDGWIKAHFGPVDWELVPSKAGTFTADEISQITNPKSTLPYRYLSVVSALGTLFASDKLDADGASLQQANLLGFDFAAAANFDPSSAAFWRSPLKRGEAILDRQAAELLGLKTGDAVYAADSEGQRRGFILRETPPSAGLSGYRGEGAKLSATLLLHPDDARMLTGLEPEQTSKILVTRMQSADSVMGMSFTEKTPQLAEIRTIKYNALNQANSKFVVVILAISLAAVFSSAFLLRQIVLMLAESRSELYGVLRAIGLSRKQIRSLFCAEALLLGLLSGAVGIAAGLAGGYALVRLIYGTASGREVAGTGIPVEPSMPLPVLIGMVLIVLAYQLLLVLLASRKAGAGSIVALMRGSLRESGSRPARLRAATGKGLLVALIAAAVLGLHLYHTFGWQPKEASGSVALQLLLVWLASSAAIVFLLQLLLTATGKLLGPKAGIAGLLALRYTGQRPGRSFTVMLLFAVAMMTITFTSGMSGLMLGNMEPKRNIQTMLGYGGFVPYESEREKKAVLDLLANDEMLRKTIRGHVDVKPIMVAPQLTAGSSRMGQSLVPVTKELATGGSWALTDRAAEFASDQEAWEKVMSDPTYIVLPVLYKDFGTVPSPTYWRPDKLYKPGDDIELSFFRKEVVLPEDKPDLRLSFTIAGFAAENTASNVKTQYVFSTTYAHPDIWRQLEDYHHPWSDQTHEGMLLLDLDYSNLSQDEQIVSRLVSGGATQAIIPYLDNSKTYAANSRLVDGFIAFTALSAVIGLLGLAVLQKRSIHERQREIAMLRSAGMPSRHLFTAFTIEGSLLGSLGLLAGWAVGLTGATAFIRVMQSDLRPWEKAISVDFNWLLLIGVMLVLMGLAFLFQLGPSRGALKGSAVEALRGAEQ
ncbi:ABC-type transport system, involved in lipoprotein release, permease component [Paenibacillaceae bacterium GAS479]|nr:ABC-type transport system, involved in lipoprotein release, permease component [Paenibacillaceae bacterium GAS479]